MNVPQYIYLFSIFFFDWLRQYSSFLKRHCPVEKRGVTPHCLYRDSLTLTSIGFKFCFLFKETFNKKTENRPSSHYFVLSNKLKSSKKLLLWFWSIRHPRIFSSEQNLILEKLPRQIKIVRKYWNELQELISRKYSKIFCLRSWVSSN